MQKHAKHHANQFILGIQYFLQGLSWLKRPGLRRFIVWPLCINILSFIGLIWLGAHFFAHFSHWLESFLPRWLQWISWVLWLLFALAASIVMVYGFTLLANLIGAPFNGLLSEKVLQLHSGKSLSNGGSIWSLLKEVPRALSRQLAYMVYYLLRALVGILLFFIPGVQIIAAPLWFAFNAWMMSLQYLDYPMDNAKIDFASMREHMAEQRLLCFGFGFAVLVATLIPILNFFVMPAAVIGATILFSEHF